MLIRRGKSSTSTFRGRFANSDERGVIAIALTLTFLIPMVLFSATTGAYTSRRSSLRILRQFFRDARSAAVGTPAQDARLPVELRAILNRRGLGPSSHQPNWDEYFHSLHWDGGKETYRPWKVRHILREYSHSDSHGLGDNRSLNDRDHDIDATVSLPSYDSKISAASTRRRLSARMQIWYRNQRNKLQIWWWRRRMAISQFLISICPILAGLGGGVGILHLAGEGGWSCRHLLLFSMLGIWLLSSAFSSGVYNLINPKDGKAKWIKYHWYACLFKDMLIGGAILGWVSISAAGMFCLVISVSIRRAPSLGVFSKHIAPLFPAHGPSPESKADTEKAILTVAAAGAGNCSWAAVPACLWTSMSAICGTTPMCFRGSSAELSGFNCCLLLRLFLRIGRA